MSDMQVWQTTAPRARVASESNHVPLQDSLKPGTFLAEFEIVRVLGAGGFGIVYLARDHVLLRYVAIKEYMPATLAGRGQDDTVSLRSTAVAETFATGLESFLNEAQLLASFDHPSLVKVHRFWKDNGTAYMAMQYYPGQTLKDARRQMSAAPDEAWLSAFIEPLLGALELLHGQGVFHRDISPDNILMLDDGRPVLLDFGSARRVIGGSTQSLTALLKPNFAPVEQYGNEAGMRQGPWTDLYSFGATVHFVLTGQAPLPSVLRAVRDSLPTLSSSPNPSFPGVSAKFLATVDWALALAPDERPQSVGSVRRALSGELAPPSPSLRHKPQDRPGDSDPIETPVAIAVATASAAAAEAAAPDDFPRTTTLSLPKPKPEPEPDAPALGRSRLRRRVGLGAAAALALLGIGVFGWGAFTLTRTVSAPPSEPTIAVERTTPTTPRPPPPAVLLSVSEPTPSVEPVVAKLPSEDAARRRLPAAAPRAIPRSKVSSVASRDKVKPRRSKDTCEGLGFLARTLCVIKECKAPRMHASALCVESRRAEEARQRRMEQG